MNVGADIFGFAAEIHQKHEHTFPELIRSSCELQSQKKTERDENSDEDNEDCGKKMAACVPFAMCRQQHMCGKGQAYILS